MAGAPYIVWNPEGEAPAKVAHQTHGAAYFAATQMAAKFPGQRFFVMARAGKGVLVEPPAAPAAPANHAAVAEDAAAQGEAR